jgi:glycosyltransferase involved in cell wall biosynthesis
MFGDGPLMKDVVTYVEEQGLKERIKIYGNKDKAAVKQCLKDAHFTILPSKSEGWPKAIAEGMFFGAIPISTKISCLPWMLDYGHRGILIDANAQEAVTRIVEVIEQGSEALNAMAERAMLWSQQYTIDRLEQEIAAVVDKGFEYSEKKA